MGSFSSKLIFYYQPHTHFMDTPIDVQDEQSMVDSVSFSEVSNPSGFDYPFQALPKSIYSFNIASVPCCITSSLTIFSKYCLCQ